MSGFGKIPNFKNLLLFMSLGFGILDILYLLGHDAGEYTLTVSNDQGSASTSTRVEVTPKEGLLLQPVNENKARAVQQLEDSLNRRPEEVELAPEERIPVFVEPLGARIETGSGDRAHFSARYEPANAEIAWFLNGRPLVNASRVKTLNSFGTVVLEISPVYPGKYLNIVLFIPFHFRRLW